MSADTLSEPIDPKASARAIIVDALEQDDDEQKDSITMQGVAERPSIPLVGSMNVSISASEEAVES